MDASHTTEHRLLFSKWANAARASGVNSLRKMASHILYSHTSCALSTSFLCAVNVRKRLENRDPR